VHSGVLAEFDTPEGLVTTAKVLLDRGYRALDTFTPYPMHDSEHALGLRRSRLPFAVFPIAVLGAVFGYWVQWYTNAVDYWLNAGGRPAHAPPPFVLITFETCVLFSAFATVVGLVLWMGLPKLWHPVFEVPGFERASIDRFWLGVDETDPRFDRDRTAAELIELGALRVAFTPRASTSPSSPERAPEGGPS
jgi:hypothetical protein